ncbi:MAG: amidase [Chloroflexota bacterium]|nr:amidase [Chloroflexota bacterium]
MSESTPELFLTIRETARRFRSGELSPVDLTRATLDRIQDTNQSLRQYVEIAAARAIEAAESVERTWRQQPQPELVRGIPFAVKDIIDVEGLPTRCGSAIRQDVSPATNDAAVVRALHDAGGVMIGKTVTQEFAAGTLSPPARNPWDATRVPGGSSGGSAVAVATGTAMTALGSDTGGSIRNPASLCGVVGLKPTFGSVSTAGVYPLSWSLDTVGPLSRTVEDAWLTFAAIKRDEPGEAFSRGDLRGFRLGVPRPYFFDHLEPETRAAVECAIVDCRELGAIVIETSWHDAAAARACAFLINRIETVAVHESLLRENHDDLDRLNPNLRLRLVAGQFIPAGVAVQAQRARSIVTRSIADYFSANRLDAVLTPVSPAVAVPPDAPWIDIDGKAEDAANAYTRLTQPFNATGQPAISIPCGFSGKGLPIGLQIAGRPFQERLLCEIAHVFEQSTVWHQRRPLI